MRAQDDKHSTPPPPPLKILLPLKAEIAVARAMPLLVSFLHQGADNHPSPPFPSSPPAAQGGDCFCQCCASVRVIAVSRWRSLASPPPPPFLSSPLLRYTSFRNFAQACAGETSSCPGAQVAGVPAKAFPFCTAAAMSSGALASGMAGCIQILWSS